MVGLIFVFLFFFRFPFALFSFLASMNEAGDEEIPRGFLRGKFFVGAQVKVT